MNTVYVVVLDKTCEFGPPVAVFTTRNKADSYVAKKRQEQIEKDGRSWYGFLIYPFNIDDETGCAGKAALVDKDGKVVEF